MIRGMVNTLFLLFLLIVSVSTRKQGDFGIFSACTKNNTIRLKCYYPPCNDKTPFNCEFFLNGTRLGSTSGESCENFTDPQMPTSVTNYTCILTRRKRRETKTELIDPNATEKKKLKTCSGTPGMHLHQTPTILWPLMVLPLWGVLATDRELT